MVNPAFIAGATLNRSLKIVLPFQGQCALSGGGRFSFHGTLRQGKLAPPTGVGAYCLVRRCLCSLLKAGLDWPVAVKTYQWAMLV